MKRFVALLLFAAHAAVGQGLDLFKVPKLSGSIGDHCSDVERIDSVNAHLWPLLQLLKHTTFFRIFKVNLQSDCPFWAQNVLCESNACGVCECAEDEVPLPWKLEKTDEVDLSLFPKDSQQSWTESDLNLIVKPSRWDKADENQWIIPADASDSVYVDIQKNPESYTGYAGVAAHRIWSAIYKENCFAGSDICLEGQVMYRILSGLHACIACHISEYYVYPSGENAPNLSLFQERLGDHPERIRNIYFVYAILLRALDRAAPLLRDFAFVTGNVSEDAMVTLKMTELVSAVDTQCDGAFDESVMFAQESVRQQFQRHFRNISLIMDCVTCEKCRLHGKLQINGLGTAFKILFARDLENIKLRRNEVTAFINTLAKFSHGIEVVERMRKRERERLFLVLGSAGGFITVLLLCLSACCFMCRRRRLRKGSVHARPKSD